MEDVRAKEPLHRRTFFCTTSVRNALCAHNRRFGLLPILSVCSATISLDYKIETYDLFLLELAETKKWTHPNPHHVSQSERHRSGTVSRAPPPVIPPRPPAKPANLSNSQPNQSKAPAINVGTSTISTSSDSIIEEKRDSFAAKKSMSDQAIDVAPAPGTLSPNAKRASVMSKTPSDPRLRNPLSIDVRFSHSAVTHLGSVWIFAGTSLRTGQLTNSIIRYDVDQQEWDTVDPVGSGPVPKKRRGHVAVIIGNSMYIFGGADESDKPLQDIWRFNFDARTWNEIQPNGEIPASRYHHSAVASYNRLFVYGGFDGSKELNDFYSFNPGTNTWQLELPRKACMPPGPKQGHTLTAIGSNVYLIGGSAGNEDKLDIHIYSIDKQVWSQVAYDYSPGRERPPPEKLNRRFHAAVPNVNTRSHQLLLFGGTNAQNSARLEQLTFVVDAASPLESADTSVYNTLPQKDWESIAMSLHPEILTLREQLRSASQLPSYGRQASSLHHRTQVKEVLPAHRILQLIMEWLSSRGYNNTLAKIQQDTAEQYVKQFNTTQTSLESLLNLVKRRLPANLSIWSPQVLSIAKEERVQENLDHLPSFYVDEESEALKLDVWEEDIIPNQNLRIEGMLVYAGTLNVLLHMLVDYGAFVSMTEEDDGRFYEEFRLCFFWMLHSFTSPEVLLKKLIQLFEVPDELEETSGREHQNIVISLLKFWIENCKWDWSREKLQEQALKFVEGPASTAGLLLEARELRQAIHLVSKEAASTEAATAASTPSLPAAEATDGASSTSSTPASSEPKRARTISVAVGRAMREQLSDQQVSSESPAPEPLVPKNIFHPKLSLDDVVEVEIARQMTIVQYNIFSKICPPELCKKWWTSDEADLRSPNVRTMLRHWTRVQRWVIWQVVKQDNLKNRQKSYDRMVRIAECLRQLNNFDGTFAFYSGLTSKFLTPYQASHKRFLETTSKLREEKYQGEDSYATALQRCETIREPCIPYLKYTLDSIERWEDMLPDTDSMNRTNFHKRRLLWQCICDIVPFQRTPYNLLPIFQIAVLLRFSGLPSEEEVMVLAARATT